ncbi:MAG: hypothetical protein OEN23_06840 [Paracoccaceae bacterium]|nr:hypothetical protein [Paracoccaceae bacterium]
MLAKISSHTRIAGAVLLPVLLSACASSDVTGVTTASQDAVRSIRVSEVSVTMQTPKPNPLLEANMKSALEAAMGKCATGTVDHRLAITITDFEEQDVAKAILVGDEIELEGRAKFANAADETVTGEYFVENSFFWGGFVGAAMMSDAEKQLSEDFAANLCEEVFGVDLKQQG